MSDITRAISLWQPMAWAIAHGTKRVENRTWKFPERLRGTTIAVHAAKKYDRAYAEFVCEVMGLDALPDSARDQGAVIGVMRLLRCVTGEPDLLARGDDPLLSDDWFMGPVGWEVDSVVAIPEPIPCRGRQQIWTMSPDVRDELARQLGAVQS